MAEPTTPNNPQNHTNKHFLIGLARAFSGAILFAFPMLMTMEMWSLGSSIERYRLVFFLLLSIPLLVGLSYYVGFEETETLFDDVIDAFVAYAVGSITAAVMLWVFGVLSSNMSAEEIIGIISIQAAVAAIGAMLAQSQLGMDNKESEKGEEKKRNTSYLGEMFLMIVGAVFLAMNAAPTEEMVLISYKMSDFSIIFLAIFTMIMMHAFVYQVEFRGQKKRRPPEYSVYNVFFRYTLTGYALVLLISFYLLWTFGRTDGLGLESMIKAVIVMGFPAALGASASRLIL